MTLDPNSVTITHENPDYCGTVKFRLPQPYTAIAIGARVSDLANSGRDPELPRLHPADLPLTEYRLAYAVATLEYVIEAAPKALYEVRGKDVVLNIGALAGEDEPDGLIMTLYAAYAQWRSSFRRPRAAGDEQPAQDGRGSADAASGPQDPGQPT